MKKVLPLLLGILALGLGIALALQAQQRLEAERLAAEARKHLEAARADLAKKSAEVDQLRSAQQTYDAEAKALRERLAAAPAGTAAPADSSEQEATAPAPGNQRPATAGFVQQWSKMLKDPEMKEAMRAQQGFGIRMLYGDLTKELGLSAEETDQLTELLTERQLALSTQGMELMNASGDKAQVAEASKAAQVSKQEYDAQIKNVLGEQRFAEFQDYESSLGDRMMLRQFQDQFTSRGTPLADNQRDQLLAIMSEERKKGPAAPAQADVAAQLSAMQSDEGVDRLLANQQQMNARVLDRARQVLTPEQVNALAASQKQMLEMQKMGMRMSREMMKQGQ